MKYFKKKSKVTFLEKVTDCSLRHFVPLTNPTLENNLDYVKEWYIENDDVEEYTNREVGVTENGLVVFKAPF